jgi:Zn-dependent M28 family amino/carboxypeptidase
MPSSRSRRAAIFAVLALGVSVVPITAAAKGPVPQVACDNRDNNSYAKLLDCVRLSEVREHQAAFQAIADENDDTRADNTQGYLDSVEYVVDTMEAAGWEVDVVDFDYDYADVLLRQISPVAATFPANPAVGTGEGDVTGNVIPVDINLTGDRANSSGCNGPAVGGPDNDFANLDFSGPNDIALVQRGTCAFADKARNAEAAGAEAVVIFNQGDPTGPGDRFGPVNPTLAPFTVGIPTVGTSFAGGESLAQTGSTAQVRVDFTVRTSSNVFAELAGVNADNVVMAGAHLDSVPAGPGINDNGSGPAVLLEVAEQLANHKPQNTLRFAWWGAEELGLLGSTAWVNSLSDGELAEIALYLNFDLVGSPNHVFMVYDANQSSFLAPVPVPDGSAAIETVFESFYTYAGVPYDDTQFSGRSDYQAFILNGIPSSGLFTGAEVIKTAEQAAIWGGTAGAQFDPCYHLACDTFANNNDHALDVNADAVAWAVLTYAYSTEAVNGVPGIPAPANFQMPEPAGPEHTFAGPLGGDDEHDHHHHHHHAS